MTGAEALEWFIRLLAVVGLPSVTTWFLRERRKLRNQNLETEATMPNRVRTSSVVTLEAEIMALSNSFDTDRRIKDETIAFLTAQLEEAREDITERDCKIDSLQAQVLALKRDAEAVTRRLVALQGELDAMRNHPPEKGKGHGTTRKPV